MKHAYRCHDRGGGKLVHGFAEIGGQGCPRGICCSKQRAVGGRRVDITWRRKCLLRRHPCMKGSATRQHDSANSCVFICSSSMHSTTDACSSVHGDGQPGSNCIFHFFMHMEIDMTAAEVNKLEERTFRRLRSVVR